ncbi:DUF3097 domain-containing protein [Microlunatus ginsengisoli]|uniref:DUF3097 domain-containing protein n=1 Tax=Microlunatus ginsengisoli TaxID=363863 RepID=A0ABP6ZQV6_9ACTN
MPHDRYGSDVLSPGWQKAGKPVSVDLPLRRGLVLEDPSSGYVGEVMRWENGLVVLEDRKGKRRSFPIGPGFWYEGKPVTLRLPTAPPAETVRRTASGSIAAPSSTRAKIALPSRIFVEGRHDAELVEKIWGADLRDVGVVVELLNGVDELPDVVAEFSPEPTRRLGVLVDHLVPNSKESRIADQVAKGPGGGHVLVLGHPYVDIWQAVKPARVGLARWPDIPRDVEWKHGICEVLGLPHDDQRDIAAAWQQILSRVSSWRDLELPLLNVVEQLIDFVTVEPGS